MSAKALTDAVQCLSDRTGAGQNNHLLVTPSARSDNYGKFEPKL